jgi:hypothetical protein
MVSNSKNLRLARRSSTRLQIEEKMRGKQQADITGLPDFANEFDQALARRRIHAIGWLVQNEDLGTMRNGLGELGQLFHAEGIRSDGAIARFA